MKLLKCLISALLLGVSVALQAQPTDYVIDREKDSLAFEAVDWQWHVVDRGIESGSAQFAMFGSTQYISVVRYNPHRHRSKVLDCAAANRSVVSEAARRNGAVAAVNGSYFNMKTLYPTTYVKVDGDRVGSTDPSEMSRVNGAVAFRRHRHIDVISVSDTSQYNIVLDKYRDALASGPVLIDDGVSCSYDMKSGFYSSRHPRTMIGVGYDGWIYLVVVDGRHPGNADGATIAEMVFLAERFGLYDALNLDGGGSSTLWTEDDGVMNHPNDNGRFDSAGERSIPNMILVY